MAFKMKRGTAPKFTDLGSSPAKNLQPGIEGADRLPHNTAMEIKRGKENPNHQTKKHSPMAFKMKSPLKHPNPSGSGLLAPSPAYDKKHNKKYGEGHKNHDKPIISDEDLIKDIGKRRKKYKKD